MAKQHEGAGVKIHKNEGVKQIIGCSDGYVRGVELNSGVCIDSQLVVIGAGAVPATDFVTEGSGVKKEADGGLICNPFLQTSDPNVFAAGDIVSYPYWPTGKRARTEHWNVALNQGTFAAFNMLGKLIPYGEIPFFWTRNYNQTI